MKNSTPTESERPLPTVLSRVIRAAKRTVGSGCSRRDAPEVGRSELGAAVAAGGVVMVTITPRRRRSAVII